jgi:ferredoxin
VTAVQLTIDGQTVRVPAGTTVLAAARQLGIEIPTLCHRDGLEPMTSCFLCVVRVAGVPSLLPSCARRVEAGMVVTTDSDEIRAARRACLELLLSDHRGDCEAPCTLACPAGLDIPGFLRAVAAGDLPGALQIIRERIPLPRVLGRICPRYCEAACRRARAGQEAIAICALKRFPADTLGVDTPVPPCAPATGRRVAIVGGGAAGLTAAWYLQRAGHRCTILEARPQLGGELRYGVEPERLPREVLDAEIETILRLGVHVETGVQLGEDRTLAALQAGFDAVLLALGAGGETGLQVERRTCGTNRPGVFAAGEVVTGSGAAVRAVAQGRQAALAIDAFLRGEPPGEEVTPVRVSLGRLDEQEEAALVWGPPDRPAGLDVEAAHLDPDAARAEAARCLGCDCLARDDCRLREEATRHGARVQAHRGGRRPVRRDASHPEVVYESGKCILCGLCVQLTAGLDEGGLAFTSRGFGGRVAAPFEAPLAKALSPELALRCAAVCPTGALRRVRASYAPPGESPEAR